MKSTAKTLTIALSLLLLTLSGCVVLPPESVSKPISTEELSAHVDFLTQPGLKGRPARSLESKIARDYLTGRLKQYGCVPWVDTATFNQGFGTGTNVIGVLDGSDPDRADEIILISAHYDHIKSQSMLYCPGAADNAAAVAVLLEIAENLSQSEQKPKRPICFAFFDAQETGGLGSFAFTARDDYHDPNVAAVINIDLLGRQFFDVVSNSLCVTGTDVLPNLQQSLHTVAKRSNMWLLPISSDLVGPVSDHAAFASGKRPVLFFSCGLYKDYHTPQDTPNKLNYREIIKSSRIIQSALLMLANAAEIEDASPQPDIKQQYYSTMFILSQVIATPEKLDLSEEKVASLKKTYNKLSTLPAPSQGTLDELTKVLKNCNPEIRKRYEKNKFPEKKHRANDKQVEEVVY